MYFSSTAALPKTPLEEQNRGEVSIPVPLRLGSLAKPLFKRGAFVTHVATSKHPHISTEKCFCSPVLW